MSDFQSILDKKNKDFYDKLCIENFKILDVDTIKLCIKKIIYGCVSLLTWSNL